jgi:hypothetical protein
VKRFVFGLSALAVALAAAGAAVFLLIAPSGAGASMGSASVSIDRLDPSRPVVVVLRGWLWDPASRTKTPPLESFPGRVNSLLQSRYGITATFVQYDWSRIPTDLIRAHRGFESYARKISQWGTANGHCADFVGHSAGAALIYDAATKGVRMGYMGTLGLPTAGRAKPSSVMEWANFYTSTRVDDIAGLLWARGMAADRNFDLHARHKDFWAAKEAVQATADGIAHAWVSCR